MAFPAWHQFTEAARNSRQNAPAQGIPQGSGAPNAPNAAGMTAGQMAGYSERYAHPGEYLFDQSTVIRHRTVALPTAYPVGRGVAHQSWAQFRAPQAQYFHPAPMPAEMGFATPMGQGMANAFNVRPGAFVHEGVQRQPMPVGMGFVNPMGRGVANAFNIRPAAFQVQGAQHPPMPVGMSTCAPMGHGAAVPTPVACPNAARAPMVGSVQRSPMPVGMGTGAPLGFGAARIPSVAHANAAGALHVQSAQRQPMRVGMGTIAPTGNGAAVPTPFARPNAARAPMAAFSNQPGASAAAAIDLTIDDEPAAATMPARAPASVPNMPLAQHAGSKRGGADSTSYPSTPAAKKPRLDGSAEVEIVSPPKSPAKTAVLPAAPTAEAQLPTKRAQGKKSKDPHGIRGDFYKAHFCKVPNRQLGETDEGEGEMPMDEPRQHEPEVVESRARKGKAMERPEAPAKAKKATPKEKPASKKKSAARVGESPSHGAEGSDCIVVAPAKPKKSAPTKVKPASKSKSAERVVESPSPEPDESEIVVARPAAVSPVAAATSAATGPPVGTSEDDDAEAVTDDEFVPNPDYSGCELVIENRAPSPPQQQKDNFVPAAPSRFDETSFDVLDTAECLRQQQQLKKHLGEQYEELNGADDEPLGEPLGEGEDLFGEGGEDENVGDGEGSELEPETDRELSGVSEDEENDGDDESEDDDGLEETMEDEVDEEALYRQLIKAGPKTDSEDEEESLYGDDEEDEGEEI